MSFLEICMKGIGDSFSPGTPNIIIISCLVKVITNVLILLTFFQHKRHGIKSSSLLTIFWFSQAFFGIIICRSSFLKAVRQDFEFIELYNFVFNIIYFAFVGCQFLLSIFTAKDYIKLEKKCPLEDKSFCSFITYCWLDSFIFSKRNKLLTIVDLPLLPTCLKTDHVWKKFKTRWNGSFLNQDKDNEVLIKHWKSSSLAWSIFLSFWPSIIASVVIKIFDDFMVFVPPLVLDLLITFIAGTEYTWRGYLYCFFLFASLACSQMSHQIYMLIVGIAAFKVKSSLYSAIYRKVMVMSNSSKNNIASGEMFNLMSVDSDKIFNFILNGTMLFSCPLRIIIVFFYLWQYIGPSCLAGLVVIAFIIPITLLVAKLISSIQEKQMKFKDIRLKHMSEILNSIKILKLSAWEIPFINKISEVRKKEVKCIQSFFYCYAVSCFLWGCAAFLVSLACFLTYLFVDERHVLSPNIVIVSLNILIFLRFSLFLIPDAIAQLVQSKISLHRIQTFLLTEEREQDVGDLPEPGNAISFKDASFSWDKKNSAVLNHIDFHAPQGSMIAVIGPVGSGKSSLLSCILGDMYKKSGSIDLKGSIAYVPQQAWILNKTIKENIIFGKLMEKDKYANTLEYCCLNPDLKLLPGGDMTEIGEKGINLSGGQKQRVSLARAVLQDADIYLLDDPLSAVDAHVGKSLFQNVIGNQGLLKDKTRILVTHNASVLPYVDLVIFIRDGKIEEMGKYKDINIKNDFLQDVIKDHTILETNEDNFMNRENKICLVDNFIHEDFSPLETQSLFMSRTNSIESIYANANNKLVEEENMETGGITFKIYMDYMRNFGIYIGAPLVLFYMGYQAFEIGAHVWLAKWSNDLPLTNGSQDIALRNHRITIFAVFGLAQALCVTLGSILLAIGASKASSKYHKLMLLSVMKSPLSFFDTTPIGRIVNRFSRDLEVIDCEIPRYLDLFLASLCFVIGTTIVIGISTPMFLIFAVPLSICYYFVQRVYLLISRQIKRLDSITRSPVYSHFQETIQGVSSIRAYNVENNFIEAFERKLDKNFTCSFDSLLCNRWLYFRLNFISTIVVVVVTLLAIKNRDSMDAAVLGLILLYANMMTVALDYTITNASELEIKSISLERITEYSNLQSEADWNVPEQDPSFAWPASGVIKFQDYSTRYRKGLELALKGLNLEIFSNEKIGVVGRTGSGKSSITLALFRIIEAAEGSIIVDNVNISKIGLHSLRSKLTIIPQEPILFCGSLRINLDPHNEYSDEALWSSLERAHLKNFVASLPDGLNHEITEGGENLSVGQRQLLCLSRALLQKAKILVLDEATAAIDVDTDSLIQETIRKEFNDHTIITIAHRLNTIMDYDRIIVMDSGKIVEIGTPSDLLEDLSSRFYSMSKEAHLL